MTRKAPKRPTIAKIIWSNIRRIQYIRDISDEDLSLMLECDQRTLRNYDKSPDCIQLKTIQLFCLNAEIDALSLMQ
ncbi:MAG: hypothetical protein K2H01_01090 [Ruminococcus sp.]|nr:hypothetical protein [Ruminococcus sp.]